MNKTGFREFLNSRRIFHFTLESNIMTIPSPRNHACRFNHKIILNLDTTDHTLSRRAGGEVRGKSFFDFLRLFLGNLQMIFDTDLGDFQDIIHILDVSFYICPIKFFRGRILFRPKLWPMFPSFSQPWQPQYGQG